MVRICVFVIVGRNLLADARIKGSIFNLLHFYFFSINIS